MIIRKISSKKTNISNKSDNELLQASNDQEAKEAASIGQSFENPDGQILQDELTNVDVSVDALQADNPNDIFAGFDFDKIDYSQRTERRRGDRRRGYRRIDDRNIISRAQQEAVSIKEQAYKEGYDQGFEKATAEISLLNGSISEFFGYKEAFYQEVSGDILDISLKIAKKIIKKEVETSKDILDSMISEALKNISKGENKITLKVNPVDVEYTKEIVPNLLSNGQFEAKIYVIGNDEVEEGSVIIETSNGVIDGNISTQIELIKEAFKQI